MSNPAFEFDHIHIISFPWCRHGLSGGSGPQAVSPPAYHAIRGMGQVLDKPVHAGSAEGAMCLTRRVAGEPQAMDKPP
jgi:hypothetical protein